MKILNESANSITFEKESDEIWPKTSQEWNILIGEDKKPSYVDFSISEKIDEKCIVFFV